MQATINSWLRPLCIKAIDMPRKRLFLDTSRINEEDGMDGPAKYFVGLGDIPACMNPPGLVQTAPITPCRCQACYRRLTWTRVEFEQAGPETNPAEPSFTTKDGKVQNAGYSEVDTQVQHTETKNENETEFQEGKMCMYADPQKGDTKVKIVKIQKLRDENGNKDYKYVIQFSHGRLRDTYAEKLRPIETDNYKPGAPPLTSRESRQNPSLYHTLQPGPRVVYMI
jgi:hypothetical protein